MRCRSCGVALVESGATIDTHRLPRIPQAVLECTSGVVTGHVPVATHDVVNVIAKGGALRGFLASTDAELGGGHEVRPLMQLLQLAIVEDARKDQATDGITVSSCTVRIELATCITGGDIH